MLTQQKETMLNKVICLEMWMTGYLCDDKDGKLLNDINRNLNSIKALIKKS